MNIYTYCSLLEQSGLLCKQTIDQFKICICDYNHEKAMFYIYYGVCVPQHIYIERGHSIIFGVRFLLPLWIQQSNSRFFKLVGKEYYVMCHLSP